MAEAGVLRGEVRRRAELLARMRGRQAEIEEAVNVRVRSISDPESVDDPEYAEGLRAAVSAALKYGLDGIGAAPDRLPPVPVGLLAQARLAARNGIDLDTVLRRYVAGYNTLCDFLIGAARENGLGGEELQSLLRAEAGAFDRLISAVGDEHRREARGRARTMEQRRAALAERLLAGELVDVAELAYGLDAHHLGLVAAGPSAAGALRDLAGLLDRRLLLIPRGELSVWAWLGGRRPLDAEEVRDCASAELPAGLSLSIGEPAEGLPGWRLTHRQAAAALPVAMQSAAAVLYSEAPALVSALQDDLLITSLRRLYLDRLEEPGEAKRMRDILREYFAADRNVSSAAASLGMSRQVVAKRLRTIEQRLGRSLPSCGLDLELALRLEKLAKADNNMLPTAS